MSEERFFWGALAESARVEEKNHRGTEGTEKGGDLCLRARCASVVQTSDKNVVLRGVLKPLCITD